MDALKAPIHFYPCGQPDTESPDRGRLLRIIHYSDCLKLGTFNQSVGKFLSLANLSLADLSSADLSRANLFDANLSRANLSSAELSSANLCFTNLSSADLSSANLSRANLSSANLSRADLSRANLSSADLSRANLSRADLSRANLSSANLNGIRWDGATHWAGAQGLHEMLNVPESLAETPRFNASVVLSQGMDGVKQGNVFAAVQAYQNAQTIDNGLEIDVWVWNWLCQFGSLHGQPAAVLFAGDKAVALDDWAGYRNTRGIAKVLIDDLVGALEDFQVVIAAIVAKKYYCSEEDQQQRQEWVKALQDGKNPFASEVLKALRKEAGIGIDEAANEAAEENG